MQLEPELEKNSKKRLIYLFCFSCGIFAIVFLKLTYLTISGLNQESKVSNNNKIIEKRYEILDRNGNVLAINVPSSSVYLSPHKIKDKAIAIQALVKVLKFSKKEASKLVYSDSPFVWVKRNISQQEELMLKYYGIIGLNFNSEQSRFYPYGNLFSHSVGMVNIDGKGISGVENTFNSELKKRNITLSMDLQIQTILHEALQKAKKTHQAKAAYGMVIDPNTAEVLAMVSLPDFNPNDRSNINLKSLFNYPTQGIIEPGSIFKPFSVAMALDSGLYDLDTILDVTKPIIKGKYIIVDYSYIGRKITIPEVLMYSSNIGTSLLMRGIGVKLQQEYLKKFGLFDSTELEITEKTKSLEPNKWTDLTGITVSYGYGLAITQATFIDAFAAMINGGIKRPLTLLKRQDGEYPSEIRVISEQTSQTIRGSLRLTVALGFGKKANVEGYEVAGKTGSAEKQVKGKYYNDIVLASFVGFFPAYQPKYAILITIDEPKRVAANGYNVTGGTLSAPVVAEVINNIAISKGLKKENDKITNEIIKNPESIKKYINNIPEIEIY